MEGILGILHVPAQVEAMHARGGHLFVGFFFPIRHVGPLSY
jgi:hypothetical protein